MGAAKGLVAFLNPVADDTEAAVRAPWRHAFDCTFEAIECHASLPLSDDDRLVIVISAHVTHWHLSLLSVQTRPFDFVQIPQFRVRVCPRFDL
jgi:hypothetical protein